MDGQRHSFGTARKRRRPKNNGTPKVEPILIAARRPDAPSARPPRRLIAASASPRNNAARNNGASHALLANQATDSARVNGRKPAEVPATDVQRRPARIVQVNATGPDDRERQRLRLIERLLTSEGRVAISRAANDLRLAGFEFPLNQDVQLQLLEHNDETLARQAITQLKVLLQSERPIKLPVFSQRLRRLEEVAEEVITRQAAADLRRMIRA